MFYFLYALPEHAIYALGVILLLSLGSLFTGKIDTIGALCGGILTGLMWLGASWLGISLIFAFFVLGSWVSHWRKKEKNALGLAQEAGGKRSARHALANAGVAAGCGFFAFFFPSYALLFVVMMASSMASACSDTFSSELGNVYGRKFVSILSFRKGKRGDDGIISLEGTLAGLLGAALIALVYGGFQGWPWEEMAIITIAGIIGNLVDSILGASLQKKGFLNNEGVNFANTLAAALFAGLMFWTMGF